MSEAVRLAVLRYTEGGESETAPGFRSLLLSGGGKLLGPDVIKTVPVSVNKGLTRLPAMLAKLNGREVFNTLTTESGRMPGAFDGALSPRGDGQ